MSVRVLVLCILIGVGVGFPRLAQAESQKEIQDTVEAFLNHIGDGQWDKVASDLVAKAVVIIARYRDGKWTTTFQTGEEWLAVLKQNASFTKFREPIANVNVTVDSGVLAYVRADFQIVRDGQAVAHGVDQFTLVREGGAWKFAAVAYTSIPAK